MNHVKFYRKMQPFTKYIQRGKKSANKKYEKVSNQPPSMPPATGEAPWISPLKGSPTESSMPMGDASIEGGMQPEVDEVSKGLENMFNVSIADINPMRSMIGDINEMIGETYTIRDLKDHYHLKIPLHEFHRLKEGDDITISVDTIKELKIRINQDVPGYTFPSLFIHSFALIYLFIQIRDISH